MFPRRRYTHASQENDLARRSDRDGRCVDSSAGTGRGRWGRRRYRWGMAEPGCYDRGHRDGGGGGGFHGGGGAFHGGGFSGGGLRGGAFSGQIGGGSIGERAPFSEATSATSRRQCCSPTCAV